MFMVPGPRVELGTPASSGQRSTDELARHNVFFPSPVPVIPLYGIPVQDMNQLPIYNSQRVS